MSTYTLGEIVVWLLLAAVLGFVLGWLAREISYRSRAHSPKPALPEPVVEAEPSVEPGPFPGSAAPREGGAAPAEAYVVKGKTTSMIYHAPGFPSYARTVADTWFASEEDAVAAGFRKPKNA